MSSKKALQRIINKDIREIEKLQLSDLGIFIQFDEENMLKAKSMIIGPKDTPFENGVLFFDIFFPNNYPYSPPCIKYYSRSRFRIHPNLYVGKSHDKYLGKVCLSVLNTWSGPKWTSIMHIGSILLILQSILTAYPIEHEPGLESLSIEKKSLYNQIVLYDNFQNLILDNMIHTPDEYQIFQEDIKAHYEKSKDMILNRLKLENQKVISRKPYTIHSGVYNYSIVIDYNNLNIKFDNYFKL